jgi:hypothetical protein
LIDLILPKGVPDKLMVWNELNATAPGAALKPSKPAFTSVLALLIAACPSAGLNGAGELLLLHDSTTKANAMTGIRRILFVFIIRIYWVLFCLSRKGKSIFKILHTYFYVFMLRIQAVFIRYSYDF